METLKWSPLIYAYGGKKKKKAPWHLFFAGNIQMSNKEIYLSSSGNKIMCKHFRIFWGLTNRHLVTFMVFEPEEATTAWLCGEEKKNRKSHKADSRTLGLVGREARTKKER